MTGRRFVTPNSRSGSRSSVAESEMTFVAAGGASTAQHVRGYAPDEPGSGAAHGDVVDHQAHTGGAHRQPIDVGADLGHVLQHLLDGGGDGELAHGTAELAVGDEQS